MLASGGRSRNANALAGVAIALGVAGLLILPLVTVPAMILTGAIWRRAPRWARLTLIAVALLYVVYRLITTPIHV